MMNKNLQILICLLIILTSCQKREWTNPFDPSCPKEIWTPTDFKAIQEGTTVKLTWSQPMNQISGFKLMKSVDGGSPTSLPNQPKGINQFVDNTLIGGKVHSYSITALAGNNLSNTVTVSITPLFASSISGTTISVIKAFAANLSTTISADGGAPITAKGICWGTTANPTISNNKTNDGTGVGSFSSSLTGLSSNTTYFARSYATNSVGTVYGNQLSFTTYFGEVSDIDGNVYQTVKIGTQIWMAENLKTTKYNDGTTIPNIIDNTTWVGITSGAYCWYNNDVTTYKATYGALYNWYAVSTNKLAPLGWHVATIDEWITLTDYLGGRAIAGGKLKEIGTVHWRSPNTGATNETGFNALPGGTCSWNGEFGYFGYNSLWWTSTGYGLTGAWERGLGSDNSDVAYVGYDRRFGFSVRCLLGTLSPPTVSTSTISNLTTSTVYCGGTITSDGGTTITSRGVCWSRTHNPTIADSISISATEVGTYKSNISGLGNNATYYVRAYATNAVGTAYGNEVSFTLYMNVPGPSVTDIDGNVYKTVKIGDQVWMAENYRAIKYRNGDAIPNVTDNTNWANLTNGAYCDFTNSITVGSVYGHLYNYFSILDSRQLCPTGWHVPSNTEWQSLLDYLGGGIIAGTALKETGIIHWNSPNSSTNISGFSAFAGSWRGGDGTWYYGPGILGNWWSSTSYNSTYSYFLTITADNNSKVVSSDIYFSKPAGCSIRCIKD